MHAPTDDDLIASFYEAAAGRGTWPAALDTMARRLGCVVVQMIGVDLVQQRLTYSHEGGDVPAGSVLDYALNYHRSDPHVERIAPRAVGDVVSFSTVFDDQTIARHPFYQDFLIPYGVRHMHGAKLFDDGRHAAMIGLMRAVGRQPLAGDDWQLAQRLCFHLSRALLIQEDRSRGQAEAAIGRAVLDRLAAPAWVLDRDRLVLQSNAAARAPGCASLLTVDAQGRLRGADAKNDTRLGAALASLGQPTAEPGRPRAAPDRAVVPLARGRGRGPVVARLLAIHADATMHAFGTPAVALLMLHDPQARALPDLFLLRAAFDFTPAEARVALALASGDAPKEIGLRHGVLLSTVQTQIRGACVKAGVRRTVELVAALHALAAGIDNEPG